MALPLRCTARCLSRSTTVGSGSIRWYQRGAQLHDHALSAVCCRSRPTAWPCASSSAALWRHCSSVSTSASSGGASSVGDGPAWVFKGDDEDTLQWVRRPQRVLVVSKPSPLSGGLSTEVVEQIVAYLRSTAKVDVLLDMGGSEDAAMIPDTTLVDIRSPQFTPAVRDAIDLLITVGGDGTMLHACSSFPQIVPPLVAFKAGTVGFLVPFEPVHVEATLGRILEGGVPVMQRPRLDVTITFAEGGVPRTFEPAVNDVSIHRGHIALAIDLDMTINGSRVPMGFMDGVVIATCTGSTAYNLSAGGPLVSPKVKAMLVTPICASSTMPSTMLPENCSLQFQMNTQQQSTQRLMRSTGDDIGQWLMGAVVTTKDTIGNVTADDAAAMHDRFIPDTADDGDASVPAATMDVDGQMAVRLRSNDVVSIRMSRFPVPQVTGSEPVVQWLQDINQVLHWNQLPARHKPSYAQEK